MSKIAFCIGILCAAGTAACALFVVGQGGAAVYSGVSGDASATATNAAVATGFAGVGGLGLFLTWATGAGGWLTSLVSALWSASGDGALPKDVAEMIAALRKLKTSPKDPAALKDAGVQSLEVVADIVKYAIKDPALLKIVTDLDAQFRAHFDAQAAVSLSGEAKEPGTLAELLK